MKPQPFFRLVALTGALSLLTSCVADKGKAERSALITATGSASIENHVVKGLWVTRVYVLRIDGDILQMHGKRGVYELSPGRHEVDVNCEFGRPTIGDLYIDAGTHRFEFVASARSRFRVRAQKLSVEKAELWIEDVATETPVVPKVVVPLSATAQNIPVFIPIPVGK